MAKICKTDYSPIEMAKALQKMQRFPMVHPKNDKITLTDVCKLLELDVDEMKTFMESGFTDNPGTKPFWMRVLMGLLTLNETNFMFAQSIAEASIMEIEE